MTQPTLRGALVGAGFFGTIQLEAWQRVRGAAIAAVCDTAHDRAAEAARRFQATPYTDAEAMLTHERPDFLDIATRPDTHLDLIRLAVRHRIPVICQKPLAPSLAEAEEAVAITRAAGVPFMVHENFRWQPWYRQAKAILETGVLGEIFSATFRLRTGDGRGQEAFAHQPYFRAMPRLLIYETLSHQIDVVRYLVGEPASVYALTRRISPHIAGEDQAVILMSLQSGTLATIDGNRHSEPPGPEPGRAMACLTLEGRGGHLTVTRDGRVGLKLIGQPEQEVPVACEDDGYRGRSVDAIQQHFIDCLTTGQPFETSGEDYLKTAAAVFACYRSAETGLPVAL